MVDGLDVLFRIALAVLRNNEQELLRCESIPAVYVALESLPNRMWRSDKLLKVCPCAISLCYPSIDPTVVAGRGGVAKHTRPCGHR